MTSTTTAATVTVGTGALSPADVVAVAREQAGRRQPGEPAADHHHGACRAHGRPLRPEDPTDRARIAAFTGPGTWAPALSAACPRP